MEAVISRIKKITRVNKKTLTNFLLALLVIFLSAAALYSVFGPGFSGNKAMLGGLIANMIDKEDAPDLIAEEEAKGATETVEYEMKAKEGEGITHLARRAVNEYSQSGNIGLNSEQRVFAEDYIQKRLGSHHLEMGERLNVPHSLVDKAVTQALELSDEQLNNLRQFSSKISLL